MRINLKNQGGFTLIEVTIILLVLVILSMIMLPQMGNFNRLARFVKAKEDLIAVCANVKKMLDEVMLSTVYKEPNGQDHTLAAADPIGLLMGPGAFPTGGSVANSTGDQGITAVNSGTGSGWYHQTPSTNCFDITTDVGAVNVVFGCDFLENHLQRNDPFGNAAGTRYKNVFDDLGDAQHPGLQNILVGGIHGWRGPYLDSLQPDPWGNRYQVNTFALFAPPAGDGDEIFSSAVVCYSTGPDLGVDTKYNQKQTGNAGGGWVTGGDDLAVILSAYGPF